MKRAVFALLVVAGCHKESAEGMPPAQDWGSAQPGSAGPAPAQKVEEPPPPPPPATQPEKTEARTLEKTADGKVALAPFSMTVPADWTQKPVTSSMRAGDFQLPAKAGAEAELVIYYFGEGGAGSVQDNLDRWVNQFAQTDGKAAKDVAKIEKTKFAGQDATVVSVSGHFSAPAMMGGPDAVDKADQSLLGAIVASPHGPYYFKLVGAKATVAASEAKFRDMLKSLALGTK